MGNYDDIGLPVRGQPISSGAYGIKVRNAIISLDTRLSTIEGSLLPRYYTKPIVGSRASTITPVSDAHLTGIPLELGTFEIEFVGLFTLTTTGTQGLRTKWAFTGTATNPVRNCLGPGDSASNPNNNATLMAQAFQSTGQEALYFTAASAAYASIREITNAFTVTAAGNFSFAWAQAVSSANNTNLQPGSYLRITRYA